MPKLTRERRRELRGMVNKAVAARIRTTNLSEACPADSLTTEELEYAATWRDALANDMDKRNGKEAAPGVAE